MFNLQLNIKICRPYPNSAFFFCSIGSNNLCNDKILVVVEIIYINKLRADTVTPSFKWLFALEYRRIFARCKKQLNITWMKPIASAN